MNFGQKNFYRNMSLALVSVFGLVSFGEAQALQFVDATENSVGLANVSIKGINRIAIEGGRIKEIKFIEGELSWDTNSEGSYFIRPLKTNKKITGFVLSDTGKTYQITFNPQNISDETIIIREGSAKVAQDQERQVYEQKRQREVARNSEPYVGAVKSFFYAMKGNGDYDDLTCQPSGENVPLWNEAIFIRQKTCSSANLNGQVFNLTNTSNAEMVLEEPEFYKKGVIGVSIDELVLEPGESTEVMIATEAR